jgi:flagellar biosynthesis/type III secretory pathway protein FliH
VTVPDFIPLADMVRPPTVHVVSPLHVVPPLTIASHDDRASSAGTIDADVHGAVRDAVRDARLFRARLADAFDESLAQVLRELAVSVLARELRLAPCALAAIVRRVAERTPVVRLRLAPADASHCTPRDYGFPVVEDSALDAGDAVLEVAGGAVDARLGVRLAGVLEAIS